MYKLEFSDEFSRQLISFTDDYHSKNIELFLDSGLEVEEYIISNYVRISKVLRSSLSSRILEYFTQDIIAKSICDKTDKIYCRIQVKSISMDVYFSENLEEKIRTITSIEFFRK